MLCIKSFYIHCFIALFSFNVALAGLEQFAQSNGLKNEVSGLEDNLKKNNLTDIYKDYDNKTAVAKAAFKDCLTNHIYQENDSEKRKNLLKLLTDIKYLEASEEQKKEALPFYKSKTFTKCAWKLAEMAVTPYLKFTKLFEMLPFIGGHLTEWRKKE